ncbi:MAG: hypothetical protein K5907_05475 [Treponema sp.]|nr:hypothetical protein [Treponema sp.]
MADVLNADYWKKAYLLEFKTNKVLTDAFTFSVPPENEEFIFPQRKNETKTFGGVVVADYGNDTVQINLSGSTINQELKLIYKSSLGSDMMSGEQEIFYLRDLLKRYGQRENLINKEVYLYSLNGGGNVQNNPKWWRIYIGQLDISRNKDKPFCYNYKFSAIGDPEVTKNSKNKLFAKLQQKAETVTNWANSVKARINEVKNYAEEIEDLGGVFIKKISDSIGSVMSIATTCEDACDRYINAINGILTDTTEATSDVINSISDVVTDTVTLGDNVIYSAFRYYPTLAANVWNSCVSLGEECKKLSNYCSDIDELYVSESSLQMVKELFDDSVSDTDISDVYSTLGHQCLHSANLIVQMTSKNLNNLSFAVIPGDTGVDDKIVPTYGYKVISITDAETNWDQLAYDYYGDPSLACVIAMYNNSTVDFISENE